MFQVFGVFRVFRVFRVLPSRMRVLSVSPVRATVLQLSLDLQLRTVQLSRYARSKRRSSNLYRQIKVIYFSRSRSWISRFALRISHRRRPRARSRAPASAAPLRYR